MDASLSTDVLSLLPGLEKHECSLNDAFCKGCIVSFNTEWFRRLKGDAGLLTASPILDLFKWKSVLADSY